jgi:hypothetical protein
MKECVHMHTVGPASIGKPMSGSPSTFASSHVGRGCHVAHTCVQQPHPLRRSEWARPDICYTASVKASGRTLHYSTCADPGVRSKRPTGGIPPRGQVDLGPAVPSVHVIHDRAMDRNVRVKSNRWAQLMWVHQPHPMLYRVGGHLSAPRT